MDERKERREKKGENKREKAIEGAMSICQNGQSVLKYANYGAPHKRYIRIDEYGTKVYWVCKLSDPTHNAKYVNLKNAKVYTGRNTKVFKRYKRNTRREQYERSLSIVSAERTLDVEFDSDTDRSIWALALEYCIEKCNQLSVPGTDRRRSFSVSKNEISISFTYLHGDRRILKRGFLSEKKVSGLRNYQERYFLLQDNYIIHYFKKNVSEDPNAKASGRIDIAYIKCVKPTGQKGSNWDFSVYSEDDRTYQLRTKNQTDRTEWINAIRQQVEKHKRQVKKEQAQVNQVIKEDARSKQTKEITTRRKKKEQKIKRIHKRAVKKTEADVKEKLAHDRYEEDMEIISSSTPNTLDHIREERQKQHHGNIFIPESDLNQFETEDLNSIPLPEMPELPIDSSSSSASSSPNASSEELDELLRNVRCRRAKQPDTELASGAKVPPIRTVRVISLKAISTEEEMPQYSSRPRTSSDPQRPAGKTLPDDQCGKAEVDDEPSDKDLENGDKSSEKNGTQGGAEKEEISKKAESTLSSDDPQKEDLSKCRDDPQNESLNKSCEVCRVCVLM